MQCFGAISISNNVNNYNNDLQNSNSENSSSAGDNPLSNSGSSEVLGLAVFKGDKLVGELSSIETMCHLLITNDLESCNISIPDSKKEGESIDLYVYNKSSPKIKVEIINGSPYISIKLNLYAKILSVDKNSDYDSKQRIDEITSSANYCIKKVLTDYLYKTSKEYNSDIDNFGNYSLSHFITTNDFLEYNWLENYNNAFFNVDIETSVQSAFLLTE